MTDYFHRRNRPSAEYSGHEEVSPELRSRINLIYGKWLSGSAYSGNEYWIPKHDFEYKLAHQFPEKKPADLLSKGTYDEIFTIVEMLLEASYPLNSTQEANLKHQLSEAFRLSGSVYGIRNGLVAIVVSKDLAEKIAKAEGVLAPHQKAYKTFFDAVGDLVQRRAKPADVVKNLFVGAEGYLKAVTGANEYGEAVKSLQKSGLNVHQGKVMNQLYAYRSDCDGAAHAGNTPAPKEADALWFLETMLAQIALVDRVVPKAKASAA